MRNAVRPVSRPLYESMMASMLVAEANNVRRVRVPSKHERSSRFVVRRVDADATSLCWMLDVQVLMT